MIKKMFISIMVLLLLTTITITAASIFGDGMKTSNTQTDAQSNAANLRVLKYKNEQFMKDAEISELITMAPMDDLSCSDYGEGWAPYNLELYPGWNLISLPHSTLPTEIPLTHYEPFYYYESFDYHDTTTMIENQGYYVYSSSAEEITMCKNCDGSYNIDIMAGWNIIPGPCCTVSIAEINSTLEIIVEYNYETGAYSTPDYLEPGKAYWAFSTIDQTINMPSLSCRTDLEEECKCDIDNLNTYYSTDAEMSLDEYGTMIFDYGNMSCSLSGFGGSYTTDCVYGDCHCDGASINFDYSTMLTCTTLSTSEMNKYIFTDINDGTTLSFGSESITINFDYEIQGSCCGEDDCPDGLQFEEVGDIKAIDLTTTLELMMVGGGSYDAYDETIFIMRHNDEAQVVYFDEDESLPTTATVIFSDAVYQVRSCNAGQDEDSMWACASVNRLDSFLFRMLEESETESWIGIETSTATLGDDDDSDNIGRMRCITECEDIVEPGTYYICNDINGRDISSLDACINIMANDVRLNGLGHTITSDGESIGIKINAQQNNLIKDVVIREFAQGIILAYSNENVIDNVKVTDCRSGIRFQHTSSDNIIKYSQITSNYDGIYLSSSAIRNKIISNIVCDNQHFDITNPAIRTIIDDNVCDTSDHDAHFGCYECSSRDW